MNTVDFKGELTNGQITVPPEILSQLPAGEQLQVVLLWGNSDDDTAWCSAGRRQFEAAYADDDSIYEQLIHDPSTR
jgi:1,4-dihydroxy-2-naphthoyl-CoA synthase